MKKGELDTKLNRYKASLLSLGDTSEGMVCVHGTHDIYDIIT